MLFTVILKSTLGSRKTLYIKLNEIKSHFYFRYIIFFISP